jgi:ribosomal protein L11 methyltransferase
MAEPRAHRHLRWKLDVPDSQEVALCAWLDESGASAFYREADPPQAFFAYFPPGVEAPELSGLSTFQSVSLIEAEGFDDEDWLAKSREGFASFEVGEKFFIRPLWDEQPGPSDRTAIVVNPGLAFGTGGHETTRLCMALLEKLAREQSLQEPILDIGAGTGILALTAQLLGARKVAAFDNDPDCGPAMAELIDMNAALLKNIEPFEHFIGTLDPPRVLGPYRGLLANILLETIQMLLPRMAEIAAPGAWLIASGILAERMDEALVSLVTQGFSPLEVVQEGEWIAIHAVRS